MLFSKNCSIHEGFSGFVYMLLKLLDTAPKQKRRKIRRFSMEVISPTWNQKESSYFFKLQVNPTDLSFLIQGEPVYIGNDTDISNVCLPVIPDGVLQAIVQQFIEQTKQWFATPLSDGTMKKRLRHTMEAVEKPVNEGWFHPVWKPTCIQASRSQFVLTWRLTEWNPSVPKISADFLMGSSTPRAQTPQPQSPDLPTAQTQDQELRTIQIQDTLVPIGDLPLSDLPPLSFLNDSMEGDVKRQEIRQKIREARLRVALAKLKAQRMEQRYYERYGEAPVDSEDSSELSSDSDSAEGSLGRQSYS